MGRITKKQIRDNAASRQRVAIGNIVLVGTYRTTQLQHWRGWYNYPINANDTITDEDVKKINELWLFNGTKSQKTYKAEFIGIKTRDELVRGYGYPIRGKAHGERYLLFKTELKYQTEDETPKDAECVIIRTADFATAPKVRKQLKEYLESRDRNDPDLAKHLPEIITRLRSDQLHVCESGFQLDFFLRLMPESAMKYARPIKGNYSIASLFAGCGGLDLGFIGGFDFLGRQFCRNKFDVVWANELNPNACKTYERNFGAHIVCGDIREKINDIPVGVDVIMGGFPCQDISINGKMQGINGNRSCLYSYIVEAVKRCRPKVFIAENVGSLMLKQNEYSFKTILADFEALDYNITYHVYHAEQYGVPQTRERIIFVGTRKDLPKFDPPAPVSGNPMTCGEALRDLEDKNLDKEFSHVWSTAAPSGEQGCRRMVEDRPGYTIRAECHGNIQFHYKLPRRLSMREAARIQSFPDSFIFPCGIRETERQIGNAVPPVLAWHIARKVQKVLESAE